MSSQFTLTALAQSQIGIVADLPTVATLTASISHTRSFVIAVNSEFNLTAGVGVIELGVIVLATASELTAEATVIDPTRAEADLSAVTTLTAVVQSFTDAIILTDSFGSLTCIADLIPPTRATADLEAVFTVTAVIGAQEQFAALVVSAGTVTADISVIRDYGIGLTATSSLTSESSKIVGVSAAFTAFNSVLTIGDVINLMPALTYQIPQETREYIIIPETREYAIDSETRELIILKG
jgi:hypothetical protein